MSSKKRKISGHVPYDLSQRPRRTSLPKTTALVLLDSSALRKKVAKACEQARKKFTSATAEWERYQTQDVPVFTRELALCAGPLREEMRVLLPKFEELAGLLAEVMDEILFSGDDPSVCLARVEAHADEPDLPDTFDPFPDEEEDPDSEPDFEDELSGDEGDDDTWDTDDVSEDDFDDLMRQMMGMPPKARKPRQEAPKDSRLKDLYRELVRTLHPDQGGHMTPERMHLWHEVQDAYRKGDLARMEILHSKSGLVTDLTSAATPISRLLSIADLFEKSLRDLKRQMRPAMNDPAWKFSTLTEKERKRVLRKSEVLLREDIAMVKFKIRSMEGQLEDIRNSGKRSKRGRGGSRRGLLNNDAHDLFNSSGIPVF